MKGGSYFSFFHFPFCILYSYLFVPLCLRGKNDVRNTDQAR